MELLKEISDYTWTVDDSKITFREASRAILFNENNLIPLLYVSKYTYHKLPGGGVEMWENKELALIRECLEEVGCEIEIKWEIGKIIEYRSAYQQKQISYCYRGKVLTTWTPSFTQKELDQWFRVVWMSLDVAISTLKANTTTNYEWIFIQQRDSAFLEKAKLLTSWKI